MSNVISSTYTGQVQSTTTTSATKTTGVETGLGQDAFMKMFLAQMTNQNPLDPMDNTEFTAQLATFSQLEQLTKIASSVEGIGKLEEAITKSQVNGYLCKEVAMSGHVIPVSQGKAGSVSFTLSSAADVSVVISDQSGNQVAVKDLGSKAAGKVEYQWDGTDDSGSQVSDGVYTVSVTATSSGGQAVTVSNMQTTGLVTGWTKDTDGTVYLLLGDAALSLDKVLAVKEPASQESKSTEATILEDILKALGTISGLAALL